MAVSLAMYSSIVWTRHEHAHSATFPCGKFTSLVANVHLKITLLFVTLEVSGSEKEKRRLPDQLVSAGQ